jgi:hypothetical protein
MEQVSATGSTAKKGLMMHSLSLKVPDETTVGTVKGNVVVTPLSFAGHSCTTGGDGDSHSHKFGRQ